VADGALEIHDLLRPLAFLLGTWRGRGEGKWPGGFAFSDSMTFAHDGRPILRYEQLTKGPEGRPSHSECGYLVAQPNGEVHVTVAEPSGITEVLVGRPDTNSIVFRSVAIGRTPTTEHVTACRRTLRIEDGALVAELEISVNGEDLAPHTTSVLRLVS